MIDGGQKGADDTCCYQRFARRAVLKGDIDETRAVFFRHDAFLMDGASLPSPAPSAIPFKDGVDVVSNMPHLHGNILFGYGDSSHARPSR